MGQPKDISAADMERIRHLLTEAAAFNSVSSVMAVLIEQQMFCPLALARTLQRMVDDRLDKARALSGFTKEQMDVLLADAAGHA